MWNLKNYILFLQFLFWAPEIEAQSSCSFFSTYFGGTQYDEVKSICVDTDKNTYVTGNTYSTDLPVTPGLINNVHSGNYDAFISKFDSCGVLLWCTYFGGTNFDSAEKMALMHDGTIVFCGYTSSVNTPTTAGCFQGSINGSYDCFLTKITPGGSIIWSTYFGKSGGDFAYDIKVDALDNIVIGGTTTSTNLYTTAASFQPTHKGNTDAFIARFSKEGLLKWCTYYGGGNTEDIHELLIDADYNIIGTGGSFSTNLTTSAGAFQSTNDGGADVYLIKLDSSCAGVFSTYIGGSGIDDAWGLAGDNSGNIFLGGHTNSIDFDTTTGPYQASNNGSSDWYLTKWSPGGTLLKSTFFGGSMNDYLTRMVLYSPTELLLIGKTESTGLPVMGTHNQQNPGGSYDVFLAKFDVNLLSPTWTSYYGGSADEDPMDIITGLDFIVFSGSTNSPNYPLSATPCQSSLNMSNDGFVTKLGIEDPLVTFMNESTLQKKTGVYPNPCETDFILSSSDIILKLECRNLIGQNFTEQVLRETNNKWNAERLIPGVYILSIHTSAGVRTLKLIKE